jgi:hypothetical protein
MSFDRNPANTSSRNSVVDGESRFGQRRFGGLGREASGEDDTRTLL